MARKDRWFLILLCVIGALVALRSRITGSAIFPSYVSESAWEDQPVFLSVSPIVMPLFIEQGVSLLPFQTENEPEAYVMHVPTRRRLNAVSPIVVNKAHEIATSCPGFFAHDTREEAEEWARGRRLSSFSPPKIEKIDLAKIAADKVTGEYLAAFVKEFTTEFPERFSKGPNAATSSAWIAKRWTTIIKDLPSDFASVKEIKIKGYPQNNVEATIIGKESPDKIVIFGAHMDSTEGKKKPGAGDNASGTACVTSALMAFASLKVQPTVTLKFFAYGAEEVGLIGSKQLASEHKNAGKDVVAVLNLDMAGSGGGGSHFGWHTSSEFTDNALTKWIQKVVTQYYPEYTQSEKDCGYACSDHASWQKVGFPAACVTSGLAPGYHKASDTWEKIDAKVIERVGRATAIFMAHLGLDGRKPGAAPAPSAPEVPPSGAPSAPSGTPSGASPSLPSNASSDDSKGDFPVTLIIGVLVGVCVLVVATFIFWSRPKKNGSGEHEVLFPKRKRPSPNSKRSRRSSSSRRRPQTHRHSSRSRR